jgi:cytochrome c oxidase subunit 3
LGKHKLESKTEIKKKFLKKATRDWHPHQLLLYVGMFASTVLFLYILIAYLISRQAGQLIELPRYFTLATIMFLLSGYPVSRLKYSFQQEKGKQIIKNLSASVFSGWIFIVLQIAAQHTMKSYGYSVFDRASGFVFTLSTLLSIYVFTLCTTALIVLFRVKMKLSDPITSLIYFTNPYQRLILKMFTQSWLYLQLLWVAVFTVLIYVNS